MKISHPAPQPNIADYVERILVVEDHKVTTPFVMPLFANGSPTLLFQTVKGKVQNSYNNLTLFGQTVFPETLTLYEDFTLIAYFFKPFALSALFGMHAQELTDKPVELGLLERAKTLELQERLLNAASTQEMMALLEAFIFNLAARTKADTKRIRYATDLILQHSSKEGLLLAQKELHVTERTFQRMFEKNIGIAPNLFRRICQFNAAFQQLNSRRFDKLSDVAFNNGYADQSHYIRAFREFTNITPGNYLKFGA